MKALAIPAARAPEPVRGKTTVFCWAPAGALRSTATAPSTPPARARMRESIRWRSRLAEHLVEDAAQLVGVGHAQDERELDPPLPRASFSHRHRDGCEELGRV